MKRVVQAAAESVENDRASVAVVLVVTRNQDNGLSVSLEPSETFVEPALSVRRRRARACSENKQRLKHSPLAVLHLVH